MKNTREELLHQIEESNVRSIEQFDNYIDMLQADFINISSLVYTNETILNLLKGTIKLDNTKTKNDLNNFLVGSLLFEYELDFVGITNNNVISQSAYSANDNSFGLQPYEKLIETDIFNDFRNSNKDIATYVLPKSDTSIIQQNRDDKILFIRAVRNPQKDFDLIGYLILGINLSKVTKYCNTFLDTNTSKMLIYDEKQNKIYENGNIDIQNTNIENINYKNGIYKNGKIGKKIICGINKNRFSWNIFYIMDTSKIVKNNFGNSYIYFILIAIAAISVFSIITMLFTQALINPLKQLLKSMEKFQQGDFEQYVVIQNEDEIGKLTTGYNQMVEHIRSLITQNYAIKLKEKEAQLGALQSQINPHFLYNTLDLLYWKAGMSGQEEIANHIFSMSKLFRLSLNKGEMWLTIKEEKEFLTYYLNLQKALMSNKLQYQIDVENSLLQTKIPRFLFQPFVENSIVHGFQKTTCIPKINIFFKRVSNNLYVTIQDNGCGIEQEKINELLQNISSQELENKENYAISNVLKRMKLYFGDNFSLEINSEKLNGTEIKFCIYGYLQ